MNQISLVNETTRNFIEQAGQRVLTTAQLAESYGTESKVISNNFTRNKGRYQEGKHFIQLNGSELKSFKAIHQIDEHLKFASTLYLWTEKGAWLHAKSLNTDKAWDAYELLVDEYYRLVEEVKHSYMITDPIERAKKWIEEQQQKQFLIEESVAKDKIIEAQQPKVLFADSVSASDTSILIRELAKLLKQNHVDIGEKRLFDWLRTNGYLIKRIGSDYNTPTQKSMELGLFEIKETTINRTNGISIAKTAKVTGKGQVYFLNKLLNQEV